MAFDFRSLGSGADFDVEIYEKGFLVIRRTARPGSARLMELLAEGLMLVEANTSADPKCRWVRVDLKSNSPHGLAEAVVDQIPQAINGEVFTVSVKKMD